MKPSDLARLASQLSGTSAIVDAVESQQTRLRGPQTEYLPPIDDLEESIAEVWAGLLRIDRVGRSDDFFHLGGHSLLATQMMSRVWEKLRVNLPLVEIFTNPTLESFANVVRAAAPMNDSAAQTPQTRLPLPSRVPLSYGQQRLWFLDQLEPNSSFYNVSQRWRLRGILNVEALEHALSEIVARHEVLRTTYVIDGGEPVQVISPAHPIALTFTDISGLDDAEREKTATILVAEEARRPFDLQRGPMLRTMLLKLAGEEHVLVVSTHHISGDGWSFGIFRRELSTLYDAFSAGGPSSLAPLSVQYAEYAVWQRTYVEGGSLQEQLAYWKHQLQYAPPSIDLPTDRPRPAVQTYGGASRKLKLSQELMEGLKALSRGEGATLFMTMLAAFNVLLSRYSGQEDLVIGSAIAGRTRNDTEKLIGLFVNTVALRTTVNPKQSFRELLRGVRETTLDAYANQNLPFERLVEELNPERDSSRSPLYQVMLILQNVPAETVGMRGLQISTFGSVNETSQMDLLMNLVEEPSGLWATLTYNTDLFDGSTIERMLIHYQHLIEAVVLDSSVMVSQVPLLSAARRKRLSTDWNNTETAYPRDSRLNELIAQQAAARPDALAVIFADQRLTYAELDERANRLAHHLQAIDVKPSQRVGIFLERSLDLIVAILAVMKAGATYVPLDTAYPAKRLQMILQDADVSCLLTTSLLDELLDHDVPLMLLDKEAEAVAARPSSPVSSIATAEDLAYVIFTSGSTGRPKGVEVSHRSVVNLMSFMAAELVTGPNDVFPALASIGFDMSVPEIYLPLVSGGTLALAAAHLAGDGAELAKFLQTHGATIVHATPTTWTLLLDQGFTGEGLKRCIGAEPLPQRIFDRLMREAPGTPLWNLYGPTETTVWSTVHRFSAADEPIVVGRPIANTRIYILDKHDQLCPIGVAGEICIAGDGVAKGYRDRPDLTAEKFVPDPFSTDPAARMYRTADLGKWLPSGVIEHLGRVDHQVKIRGFRIELGEIEAVLSDHPGVREAVVSVREDTPGDKRLVAYIVAGPDVDEIEMRDRIRETLPGYMVPSAFVTLDRIPLTPNGKVDRNHLPAPSAQAHRDPGSHAPHTRMEALLAEIWKEVLGLQTVSVEDDFFHLGGHSLLAASMIGKLNESLGYNVRLSALFEAPTLGALADAAEKLGSEQHQVDVIVPIRKTGSKPALFCVSRPNVNALGFIFLTRATSKDLPVYGLQSHMANDGILAPFTQQEYEEKAAEYIAAMRRIQPEGPYFLAGFCEGAHIAFEMARQLDAMNLEIGKLCILDVWPLENTIDRKRFRRRGYKRALHRLLKSSARDQLAMLLRKLRGRSATRLEAPVVDGRVLAVAANEPEVRAVINQRLESRYWPGKDVQLTIYNGDVVVFRVAKQQPWYRVEDLSLGWRSRALGEVDIIEVPGTHAAILREPAVSIVASRLEGCIDEYLANKVAVTEPAA